MLSIMMVMMVMVEMRMVMMRRMMGISRFGRYQDVDSIEHQLKDY